jgi:hypothetical protein
MTVAAAWCASNLGGDCRRPSGLVVIGEDLSTTSPGRRCPQRRFRITARQAILKLDLEAHARRAMVTAFAKHPADVSSGIAPVDKNMSLPARAGGFPDRRTERFITAAKRQVEQTKVGTDPLPGAAIPRFNVRVDTSPIEHGDQPAFRPCDTDRRDIQIARPGPRYIAQMRDYRVRSADRPAPSTGSRHCDLERQLRTPVVAAALRFHGLVPLLSHPFPLGTLQGTDR